MTKRALIQRINRSLQKQDQALRATRTKLARPDVGDYYVIDTNRNWIDKKRVDPEELGRKLGVLRAYERVLEEPKS